MINNKITLHHFTDEELINYVWQNSEKFTNTCLETELCKRLDNRLNWINPLLLQQYGYADCSALIADLDMLARLRNYFYPKIE